MVTRNDPEEWEMRGDDKPSVKVKVKGELTKPVQVVVTPKSADTKVKAK